MTHAAPRPSLPGLTRQSILPKDVDARDKPGHDGGGGLSVGVSTLGGTGHMVSTEAVNYAQWVLDKEFPAMRQGAKTKDMSALRNLSLAVLTPSLGATAPSAVLQAMVDGLVEVRQARMERLMLAAGLSDQMGWLAMLALGVLTQVAVAVVQLERLRPQALALFVFTTAFAATVVLIGLGERPFSRDLIDDSPLRAAVASAILGRL